MEPVTRNYKRHKVDFFSVSLAEDQQKDFFGREACTQTEVTEISNLQEMTAVIKQLVKDSRYLKRELILSRQSLEAEYSMQLAQKTEQLYHRLVIIKII